MHYNLVNEYMTAKKSSVKPYVGMTATMFVGSDRYAMVVTEVLGKNKIRVDHMLDEHYNDKVKASLKDSDGNEFLLTNQMQKYTTVNEDCTSIVPTGVIYTYRKNKRWMEQGCGMWGTCAIRLGYADNYRDPNF